MKKISFIVVLFVLIYVKGLGQNSALAFPSPNNSFLGIAANIGSTSGVDVDLYTGTAKINIPITSLASNSVSIPVSLNYTGARGIRVQDYATSVGLGWQLNAGGSISRVVRCFPDEMPNGYLGTGTLPSGSIGTGGSWGKVVAANLSAPYPTWTASQASAITGVDYSQGTQSVPTADGEPDIFYVRTPFFAFQFTFDENGNPVFPNNTGMQITTNNFIASSNCSSTSCSNSSFEVIDPNGNQYYFGSSSSSVETSTTSLFGTSYTFPTTWYLDKIVTYNSKDVITFGYQSFFSSDVFNHYRSVFSQNIYNQTGWDSTHYSTTVNQPKFITKISSSLGEVDFSYTTNGRLDDPNGPILSGITLMAMNPTNASSPNSLQNYTFYYGYFGAPSNDPSILRLRLDNITITGNASTTPATTFKTFVYNGNVTLPSRSLLTNVDFWGYNTAPSSSNPSNPYQISLLPDQTYAMADILTAITDISGVTTQIGYESNVYNNNGQATTVGGLRVNQITKTPLSGTSVTTQYLYVDNNNGSTGQVLNNSYAINTYYTGSVNCNYPITEYFSESPSNIYDLNGNFIGYSSVKVVDPNGGWTILKFSNFSDFSDHFNYSSASGIPDVTSSVSFAYKRGLCLNKLFYNAAGSLVSEDYTPISFYNSFNNPVKQSSWGYHWYTSSASVAGGYCSISGGTSTYWGNIENYLPTQTIHKDYDANGTTLQTTSTFTYVTGNSVPSNNYRLLQSISTTDSKGNAQTKTFNYVGDTNIPLVTPTENTAIAAMIASNNISVPIHIKDNKNGAIRETHNAYTGFTYGANTNTYLTTISNYATSNSNLIRQQTLNYDIATSNLISFSEIGGKSTAIAYGYNSAYPIAKIVNASSTSTGTTSNNYQFLGYDNMSSGSGSFQFTLPTAGSIQLSLGFGSYASGNITNATYYLSGSSNASGNLCYSFGGGTCGYASSVTLVNMPAGSYTLFAYANSTFTSVNPNISVYYIGPSTTVSYTNEFFYEGFEAIGNVTGGAHTGRTSYSGSYSVPFTLPNNTTRQYVMDWWVLTSGIWVFNEQPYTGPITISGQIDDVKIFPTDALMSTYTYNPLVGETGETDASGHATTYEYDGFGRPDLIRDNDGNILKKNCYNYAGQSISCPVSSTNSFLNTAISQTFTKNNCASGQTGSSVTYTVPAGTYTSNISQSDANAQAQNDINANGQAYANANGTCAAAAIVSSYNSYNGSGYYYGFTVIFQNNTTGNTYYIPSNSLNTQPTNSSPIPYGTYTVTIQQGGGMTSTSYGYTLISGSYYSGSGSGSILNTINNVNVSGASIYLSISN